jgi:hypothetical protein
VVLGGGKRLFDGFSKDVELEHLGAPPVAVCDIHRLCGEALIITPEGLEAHRPGSSLPVRAPCRVGACVQLVSWNGAVAVMMFEAPVAHDVGAERTTPSAYPNRGQPRRQHQGPLTGADPFAQAAFHARGSQLSSFLTTRWTVSQLRVVMSLP